jgi:hypothetical protein
MLSNAELKAWLATLPDEATIGVDEGGLTLRVVDDDAYLEVGGMPSPDAQS